MKSSDAIGLGMFYRTHLSYKYSFEHTCLKIVYVGKENQ